MKEQKLCEVIIEEATKNLEFYRDNDKFIVWYYQSQCLDNRNHIDRLFLLLTGIELGELITIYEFKKKGKLYKWFNRSISMFSRKS